MSSEGLSVGGVAEGPLGVSSDRWATRTAVLIVGATIWRLVWLWFSPYSLAEDEAWYWLWSRHLDWCYTTKGPGIAWAIWLSTHLFGDTAFGVRFLAPIFMSLSAWFAAGLTIDLTRSRRAGFWAAMVMLLSPAFQVLSMVMTIDPPLVACWMGACWSGWRATRGLCRGAWLALGAAVAIGSLFKLTMLLVIPGIAACAWMWRHEPSRVVAGRASPGREGQSVLWPLASVVVALLGLMPMVIWNAREGWPTVHHLLEHLHQPSPTGGKSSFTPQWLLEYVGIQIAISLVPLGMIVAGWGALRDRSREAWRYVLWSVLPLLLGYVPVALVTKTQGNWTIAAHATLAVMAGVCELGERTGRRAEMARRGVRILLGVGLVVGVLLPRMDVVALGVDRVREALGNSAPSWLLIPIHRVMGADRMGVDAGRRLEKLRGETSQEPFLLIDHYGEASLLEFSIAGHPRTYCSSAYTGGRETQFDHWADRDLARVESELLGRPALIVGNGYEGSTLGGAWIAAFDRAEPVGTLDGDGKGRPVFIGYGYRGMRALQKGTTGE
ncbi:MAG: glycosyltransferase family 39 protein [Phycisphaerales bacterium]|nr:MAG: glycosyltransferase family 39 protein [Phycisphaerales bacterium]